MKNIISLVCEQVDNDSNNIISLVCEQVDNGFDLHRVIPRHDCFYVHASTAKTLDRLRGQRYPRVSIIAFYCIVKQRVGVLFGLSPMETRESPH